jgi:FMN phosphatase YigB (HAD superfamily)
MSVPTIVAFDLGKVLLDFDYAIAAPRIAARSAMSEPAVTDLFNHSPLVGRYESGQLTTPEFFEEVRRATGFRGTIGEFSEFFADIFTPIEPMIEMHARLRRQRVLTYIFSNTNDLAAGHIHRRFPFFSQFDGYVLSHEVGAMKPAAKIYEALERLTGRRGGEIVYLDDRPDNVAAGLARGWQAFRHESPEKSRAAFERLGLFEKR